MTISYEPSTDMKFAELQVNRRMGQLLPNLPAQTTLVVQRFDTSILTSAVMTLQVPTTSMLRIAWSVRRKAIVATSTRRQRARGHRRPCAGSRICR